MLICLWGTDISQLTFQLPYVFSEIKLQTTIFFQEGWDYDPFGGHIDDNGVIYGRGTQDMKSVSIQYYEALRRLKENNVELLRDVYMTLMPGE